MKIIFLPSLLTVLLLLACPAWAQPTSLEDMNKEWTSCQHDEQCIVTTGACGYDWAVNKSFLNQAKEASEVSPVCKKTGMHHPNAVAACINNECTIILHPEWFACQTDAQCVLSCQDCGPVAISDPYKIHAPEVMDSCLKSIPCSPTDTVQCVNHQCLVKRQ